MRKLYLLIIPITMLSYNLRAQSGSVTDLDWIIGEWEGANIGLRNDGSGIYDTIRDVSVNVRKAFGGFGHIVDWYSPEGDYWGSSVRTYHSAHEFWLERWFNINKGEWNDEHKLNWRNNQLIMTSDAEKDQFGIYAVKRIHTFDKATQVYSYKNLRKYEGSTQWMLVDSFVLKKK